LQPQDSGPIADPAVRRTLSAQYGPLIEGGLQALTKALEIRPDYDDAMAYMNLLIRERADLRDNDAEYRQDVASADEWVQKALAAKRAKSQGGAANPAVGPRPPAPTRIMIAGNVQEARLIKRVDPAPTSFRGEVVLQIVVDRTGKVSDIKVTSGHPMLIANAMDAVKQWLYQVTLLNGNPVEVSTQVTLTF
jgi:TonB family protein